ncbi:LLM class flavin-dependent oxidoreductase [Lampropedia puyangensis]|uniref:LLM class flavin-dependent oxidoreductase n=1 Tax=Lampropedia puyangensis TaxID=1330072 RepID=UPI001305372D|nr:LLM class flavin-dependent oxidoreductase [Lampropedia puyangensis]
MGQTDDRSGAHSEFSGEHLHAGPRELQTLVREADSAGVALLILSENTHSANQPLQWEPGVLAAFLATQTTHIGLVVGASPCVFEPFNLARLIASTDYVSNGRAGWLVQEYGPTDTAQRYVTGPGARGIASNENLPEYISVIRKLWDSWEDDAFVRDKSTGCFVLSEKVHAVKHEGLHFSVEGALNVARPPQGQPPVVLQWREGCDLHNLEADIAIISPRDSLHAIELQVQIREQNPKWEGLVFANVYFKLTEAADPQSGHVASRLLNSELEGDAKTLAKALLTFAQQSGIDGLNLRPISNAARQLQLASRELLPVWLAQETQTSLDSANLPRITLRQKLRLRRPANRLQESSSI